MISAEDIKKLREKTGISFAQCKKALEEAGGDIGQAIILLKKEGTAIAEKKSSRTIGAGAISAYIHATGNIGAMVELNCETDFVAKNPNFRALAYDLAMQVAASDPKDIEELLGQLFIKDSSLAVGDLIKNSVQKFGEKITIARYCRLTAPGR